MTVHEHFDRERYIHDHPVSGGKHKHGDTRLTHRKRVTWDTLVQAYDPMSILTYLVDETEGAVRREGGTATVIEHVTLVIEVEGRL